MTAVARSRESTPFKSPRGLYFGLTIVLLVSLAVFSRTLPYELVSDDPLLLSYANARYDQGGLSGLLLSEFRLEQGHGKELGYYRPVVLLSIWIDGRLAGSFPWAFHATNLLLHMVISALVYVLLLILLRSETASVFGALMFAVHPAHTESVAFVSGRTDLWATFFALGATIAWLRDGVDPSRLWKIAGIALTALALLSKEVAFFLPALLLAWDAATCAASGPAAWWRRQRLWIFAWAATIVLVILCRRFGAGVGFGPPASGAAFPVPGAFPAATLPLSILATYLRLLVIPWPLSSYYTEDQLTFDLLTVGGVMTFLTLSVAGIFRSERRVWTLSLLWTIGFLAPVLGFIPISAAPVAERFLYLPSVGFCLLLASLYGVLIENPRRRRAAGVTALVMVAVLAFGAWTRATVLQDRQTLYLDMVRSAPRYFAGYFNLGNVQVESGALSAAVDNYRRALSLQPDHAASWGGLGIAYGYLGQWPEAISAYQNYLRYQPDLPLSQYLKGLLAFEEGRYSEAIPYLRLAASAAPVFPLVYLNLGLSLENIGRFPEATAAYREAIARNANFALARYSLASLALRLGDRDTALKELAALRRAQSPLAVELQRYLAL